MFQSEFARFNLGEIQNIIDNGEQCITACTDRFGVITLLGGEARVQQQAGHANNGIHGGAYFMAHHSQKRTFRLIGRFGCCPGLLYCFHRLLAFSNIHIEGKKSNPSIFYQHRNTQDFHIDQGAILASPPGHTMNDLPCVGSSLVSAGFGTILRATHDFIQVAADDLSLDVAEQLLKGRVACHNLVIKVRTDDSDWTVVHQRLKILPLAVGFQVQSGIFLRSSRLLFPGSLYCFHGLLALRDIP